MPLNDMRRWRSQNQAGSLRPGHSAAGAGLVNAMSTYSPQGQSSLEQNDRADHTPGTGRRRVCSRGTDIRSSVQLIGSTSC